MLSSLRFIGRHWKHFLAAIVGSFAIFIPFLYLWPWLATHRVERTLRFELTSEAPAVTLFFPPYTAPRLVSYSLRNNGTAAISTPRLLNNGAPRLWTLEEILDTGGGRQADPAARVLGLYDFLRAHLRHAMDREWRTGPPGNELLQAINFVGLTQCRECAEFLCQLAERTGLPAHLIPIDSEKPGGRGHAVAEVFWDSRWHMLDVDRAAFYPGPDYRRVLSLVELRRRPDELRRAPAPCYLGYFNRQRVFVTGQMKPVRPRPIDYELTTRRTDLSPDAELRFELCVDRRLKGHAVTLRTVERPSAGEWVLNVPYPLLSLRIKTDRALVLNEPARRREYSVQPKIPALLKYAEDGLPWLVPLVEHRFYIRDHESELPPVELVANMRCAPNSLAVLGEGANRLSVDSASPQWRVMLTLRFSVVEER